MEKSDLEIIAEHLASDENAFAELVRRYFESVYAFAYRITRSQDTAEDVTQETFVKAWKNITRYKKEHNFKTWLFTIARNTAFDLARKRKLTALSEFEDDRGENILLSTTADSAPTPLDESILNEEAEQVRHMLGKLSPAHQEILHLRYGEELSFEEISLVTGKPLSTVKSQCRRALIELRQIIAT